MDERIWIGPPLGQCFLAAGDWGYRASYALFALLVPLLCLPLIYGLNRTFKRISNSFTSTLSTTQAHGQFPSNASYFDSDERANGYYRSESPHKPDVIVVQPQSWSLLFRTCREQLDILGILLLCAGGILILLPLSLSASEPESWKDSTFFFNNWLPNL